MRESVVAAEAHVVAERRQHEGVGQRLGDDGQIDSRDAGPEGKPPERERQRLPASFIIISSANAKWLKPCQNQGSDFQFRNTMKSGSTGSP